MCLREKYAVFTHNRRNNDHIPISLTGLLAQKYVFEKFDSYERVYYK